jgi:hypothetical protein
VVILTFKTTHQIQYQRMRGLQNSGYYNASDNSDLIFKKRSNSGQFRMNTLDGDILNLIR